jgi:hypothetical protein
MKFYIVDETIRKNNQNPVYIFDTVDKTMDHLERMCVRKFNMTRKQYMFEASQLGHSDDEPTGRAFFELMEQYFNVGVIRGDSMPIKCNIFEADRFLRLKEVHGD